MPKLLLTLATTLCCTSALLAQQTDDNVLSIAFASDYADAPQEKLHGLEGTKITFSADGGQMNLTVHGKTVTYDLNNVTGMAHSYMEAPALTLSANEDPQHTGTYYSTFYSSLEAYTLPAGVTAYRAMTVGDAAVSLTPMEGTELPQGEAVLLQAASESIVLPLTTPSATPSADNALSGVDVQTAPAAGLCHYILSYGAQGVGFYQLPDGWKLEANKAYIAVDAPSPQMTRGLSLTFSDGTTGMESLDETDSSAVQTYNLFGQRIDQPVKAVNIVNGKKVYVK